MKKSDLKSGMLVEFEDLSTAVVIKDCKTIYDEHDIVFLFKDGTFAAGYFYDEDFNRFNASNETKINKIYASDSYSGITKEGKKLVWSREVQEMEESIKNIKEEEKKLLNDLLLDYFLK